MFMRLLYKLKAGLMHKDPTVALVSFAILCNFLMTCAKIFFGIFLHSGWFIINAVYFMALGLLRYYVLRKYIFAKTFEESEDKYSFGFDVHKSGGYFIAFLSLTYLLCCLRMYFIGDAITIGGKLVYCLLVFTLIKFAFAVYGMIVTRHRENLIVRLLKVIGTVDAFISIVPTTYAFLSMMNKYYSADLSSAIGICISFGVMISGIVMIRRKYNFDSVSHLIKEDKLFKDYVPKVFSSRKS